MTKRTVSPCLTAMRAGLKRMASVMSTFTVRFTFAALPGTPMASPWSACARASEAAKLSTKGSVDRMRFIARSQWW